MGLLHRVGSVWANLSYLNFCRRLATVAEKGLNNGIAKKLGLLVVQNRLDRGRVTVTQLTSGWSMHRMSNLSQSGTLPLRQIHQIFTEILSSFDPGSSVAVTYNGPLFSVSLCICVYSFMLYVCLNSRSLLSHGSRCIE